MAMRRWLRPIGMCAAGALALGLPSGYALGQFVSDSMEQPISSGNSTGVFVAERDRDAGLNAQMAEAVADSEAGYTDASYSVSPDTATGDSTVISR